MPLNDPFANRQAQASAINLRPAVSSPEYLKYIFLMRDVDADAVVAHAKYPFLAPLRCRDVDLGGILTPVLDRVPDQVFKQPQKLRLVCPDARQRVRADPRARF